jgi:prephenate dehydratase
VHNHFDSEGSSPVYVDPDVFHSVGSSAHLALLPQENSIFGIVTETYNVLRGSDVGESKWIQGAVTLPVQHCLIIRRGKTIRDIKRVLSHEQVRGCVSSYAFFLFFSLSFSSLCRLTVWTYRATTQALGQCKQFIAAHLPEAKLVSVASTAAAAETISTQADVAADSAAICSKICLRLFADLEMLHEGIQDERSESNPPLELALFRRALPILFL